MHQPVKDERHAVVILRLAFSEKAIEMLVDEIEPKKPIVAKPRE
jgi:hypothetical protein